MHACIYLISVEIHQNYIKTSKGVCTTSSRFSSKGVGSNPTLNINFILVHVFVFRVYLILTLSLLNGNNQANCNITNT